MKILVVGHLSIERQQSSAGSSREEFGGMYRAVQTLAGLAGKGDVILPVFGVHKTNAQPLLDNLNQIPSVDTSGVYTVDAPSPQAEYQYSPIPFSRIKPHLGVDGILLNMVSGNDITLDTLDELRMAVRPRALPIHFDYHNLTLGSGEGGKRQRRPLEEWRRWAFMLDTVQLNEEEIAGLTIERMTEQQTAGHLLTLGVKGVLVTKRERGVTVYRNERKHVMRQDIAVNDGTDLIPSVGHGDVFGASFLYHYLSLADLLASAEKAVLSSVEDLGKQSRSDGIVSPGGGR